MNEDNLKPQTPPVPTPEYKPKVPVPLAVEKSIKPLRTFEMDMAGIKGASVPQNTKKLEVKSALLVPVKPASSTFLFEKAISMTEARQKYATVSEERVIPPKIEESQVEPSKEILQPIVDDEEVAQQNQVKAEVETPEIRVLDLDEKVPTPESSKSYGGLNYDEALASSISKQKTPPPFKGSPIPTHEDLPLHILHNQAFPDRAPAQPIKPIMTYEGEAAKTFANPKNSILTMAIAESKKREGRESLSNLESSHAGRKFFFAILSLILVAGGVGGLYYLYLKSPLSQVPI